MVTDLDSPPNSNHSANLSQEDNVQQKQGNTKKIGLLALLAVVALGGYWLLGDRLSFHYLATQGSALRAYRQSHPFWAAVIAVVAYLAASGFVLRGSSAGRSFAEVRLGFRFSRLSSLLLQSTGRSKP